MVIQILLSSFLLFAISRVVLQVRNARLTVGAFLFWSGLFVFALFSVLDPRITSYAANFLGIGRGSDLIIYISIALLFYLIFRLSVAVEETRQEITQIIRLLALGNMSARNEKKIRRKKK